MKRVSPWIIGIAALALAAMQSSNPQPGHNRPDAPAQFELGRQSIANSGYGKPTEAEPEPPAIRGSRAPSA